MLWDIFCKVIDNHGDIGVCWRLAAQLGGRGERVRLWTDDASALAWMAPQGHAAVEVMAWAAQESVGVEPGDVVIEAFGCDLGPSFQQSIARAARARDRQPAWINLEYLTAEPFAARSHRLPSPVLAGPAAGLTRHFFYPGFTPDTGGLLREPGLLQRREGFDRKAWLRTQGIEVAPGARIASLFCYEPQALPQLLQRLADADSPWHLLVTAGRAAEAVKRISKPGHLAITFLPLLTQVEFDHLLWSCDLNFVRGEDSLVRALWAGAPFVWQVYPQHDDAHRAKLLAFLDWLDAPPSLRAFHLAWNGFAQALPEVAINEWGECITAARARLVAQDDLTTQLFSFVAFLREGA